MTDGVINQLRTLGGPTLCGHGALPSGKQRMNYGHIMRIDIIGTEKKLEYHGHYHGNHTIDGNRIGVEYRMVGID